MNTGHRLYDTPRYTFIFQRLCACLSRFSLVKMKARDIRTNPFKHAWREISIPERTRVTKCSWNKRDLILLKCLNVTEMYHVRTSDTEERGSTGRCTGWKETFCDEFYTFDLIEMHVKNLSQNWISRLKLFFSCIVFYPSQKGKTFKKNDRSQANSSLEKWQENFIIIAWVLTAIMLLNAWI